MRKLYAGFIVAAVILTVPWVWSWLHHYEPAHAQVALMSGLAIVGAAFLISWGAELAQLDVSRSLAMAVLSLIAVLPEYAVDIYLAWRAGKDISYASLAAANMTGGNRLLVGIGWPLIAFCAWWALRRLKRLAAGNSVQLDRDVALEIVFLSAATIYSFLIPLKHNISLLDAVILISLYVGYVCCAIRAPHREPEFIGPVKLLASLPRTGRRAAVLLLFAYSGFVIFISAEPLAESLKELGRILGIGEFFMIQWLAPLASESPEIIVVAYFALRGLPATALTAIISAKVNQWTLLISSLPIVFSISRGAINALPLDALQVEEVLLTAAQSLFGCMILINLNISLWEAGLLLGLFLGQLVMPAILPTMVLVEESRYIFTIAYFLLSFWILWRQHEHLRDLWHAFRATVTQSSKVAHSSHGAVDGQVGKSQTITMHERKDAQTSASADASESKSSTLSARHSIEPPFIQFCGAAREVTGSCHLIAANGVQVILDCGLIQGGKERHVRNREPFIFNASELDACILSHAHLDHCGRLPLLVKRGFTGRIFATSATYDLARIVLLDSGKLNEEDAEWKIKRLRKAGEDYSWVTPLYTVEDAERCLEHFEPVEYHERVDISPGISFRFLEAGHILGSAIVELTVRVNGAECKVVYTGDLGRRNKVVLRDPEVVNDCDVLILESTYGDRIHEETTVRKDILLDVIERTRERGGKVIIPSFAIERAQELLYILNDLVESGAMRPLPVFVDSPMAVEALRVFERHVELYDKEATARVQQGDQPFSFAGLHLIATVEESKRLNTFDEPCVIIAGSGMCTGGRIKHHLKHNIEDPRSTILFVGYQARGTLGRQIADGAKRVRIFGEHYQVRAEVTCMHGFSGHADQNELLWWTSEFDDAPMQVFLVHGESDALNALCAKLQERRWRCSIPSLADIWQMHYEV